MPLCEHVSRAQAQRHAARLVGAFVAAQVAAAAAGVQEELALVDIVLVSEAAGAARSSVVKQPIHMTTGDSSCTVTIASRAAVADEGLGVQALFCCAPARQHHGLGADAGLPGDAGDVWQVGAPLAAVHAVLPPLPHPHTLQPDAA
jgi:hypothetical protein